MKKHLWDILSGQLGGRKYRFVALKKWNLSMEHFLLLSGDTFNNIVVGSMKGYETLYKLLCL